MFPAHESTPRPFESAPIWLTAPRPSPRPSASGHSSYDVAIVGAGVSGLLTALLLARGGRSVVVVEARRIGDGTSGHTTGKVSLLQGTKLSRVLRSNPPSVARQYVEAGREGQAWLRRYCEEHDLTVEERHATTYATTRLGEIRARAELVAAGTAGLDVEWTERTELPYPVLGAVQAQGQFQVDPMALLAVLADDVAREGGTVHERSRIIKTDPRGDRVTLHTDDGATITAAKVVFATGHPTTLRGGYFARLRAQRSYALTVTPGSVGWTPQGMHLSSDLETRSLRSVSASGGEQLVMVGGSGHVVGRGSPPERLARLLDWTQETFPGGEVRQVWSAQDQSPADGLPYVGPVLPGERRVHVITGFDKWGLSTAPAAALLVAADLLDGRAPAWGRALRSWTPREVLAAGRLALYNGEVAWHLLAGHATRLRGEEPRPICTHLGGVLCWNDTERSWDCPLHGARFAADGTVLEGPATRPLG